MAASVLYGITARRVDGDELVRCDDATSLPELVALAALYAAEFAGAPGVRIDIETVRAFPSH